MHVPSPCALTNLATSTSVNNKGRGHFHRESVPASRVARPRDAIARTHCRSRCPASAEHHDRRDLSLSSIASLHHRVQSLALGSQTRAFCARPAAAQPEARSPPALAHPSPPPVDHQSRFGLVSTPRLERQYPRAAISAAAARAPTSSGPTPIEWRHRPRPSECSTPLIAAPAVGLERSNRYYHDHHLRCCPSTSGRITALTASPLLSSGGHRPRRAATAPSSSSRHSCHPPPIRASQAASSARPAVGLHHFRMDRNRVLIRLANRPPAPASLGFPPPGTRSSTRSCARHRSLAPARPFLTPLWQHALGAATHRRTGSGVFTASNITDHNLDHRYHHERRLRPLRLPS